MQPEDIPPRVARAAWRMSLRMGPLGPAEMARILAALAPHLREQILAEPAPLPSQYQTRAS